MEYEQWHDPWFMFWFASASVMGFVLNFSIVHCTKVNSALTTTVIGIVYVIYCCNGRVLYKEGVCKWMEKSEEL